MASPVDTLVATNSMIRISPEADSPSSGWRQSMTAVDTRPCNMAREKTVANQQLPWRRWPVAVLEGHPVLADLRCV